MTANRPLTEIIEENLVSEQLQLPVFHRVALELQQMIARDDFDIGACTRLIAEDQALASRLLREANSAFYGGLKKAVTLRDAVVRLGAREVAKLVMFETQRQSYRSTNPLIHRYMVDLWQHALCCARGAQWLAERTGFQGQAQEAFLGGLLHDIGKLFLLKVLEEVVAANEGQASLSESLVVEVLENMHIEHGGRLMRHWNLPEVYTEFVEYHHCDDFDTRNTLLTMVRMANRACHKIGLGIRHEPDLLLAATPEAQLLNAGEILLAELEIMLEDSLMEGANGG